MIQPAGFLDAEQLHHFSDLLTEERLKLHRSLGRLYNEAVQNTPEQLGEGTVRTHLADLGTDTFEQSADLGLAEQMSRTIADIDRALDRIDEGTYGLCQGCGKAISIERLEAIPSASRCAPCQSAVERGHEAS
jgi:RNA polymerase-binding protein DksA